MAKLKPQSKASRNERRKAVASTANAIGLAFLVTALFQPLATGRTPHLGLSIAAFVGFIVSQWIAHYILSRLED